MFTFELHGFLSCPNWSPSSALVSLFEASQTSLYFRFTYYTSAASTDSPSKVVVCVTKPGTQQYTCQPLHTDSCLIKISSKDYYQSVMCHDRCLKVPCTISTVVKEWRVVQKSTFIYIGRKLNLMKKTQTQKIEPKHWIKFSENRIYMVVVGIQIVFLHQPTSFWLVPNRWTLNCTRAIPILHNIKYEYTHTNSYIAIVRPQVFWWNNR